MLKDLVKKTKYFEIIYILWNDISKISVYNNINYEYDKLLNWV